MGNSAVHYGRVKTVPDRGIGQSQDFRGFARMTDSDTKFPAPELASLTSQIVAAYVARNALPLTELPSLINSVYQSLAGLGGMTVGSSNGQEPAVPIKKSVTPDYITCLEDGKRLKMLKRYLRTRYNMTPEEYRRKWNLPADYPVVAPNYAAQRSAFAKKIGLGHIDNGRQRKRRR
jgi:predicted transcriptional regulator